MKLRWKYLLVLVASSLVPLLTVTLIGQNASRRLGKTISGRAQNVITDTVKQEMARATRSTAALSLLGGMTTGFALRWLAGKAELAMALPPPLLTIIYYATDFDDPVLIKIVIIFISGVGATIELFISQEIIRRF